MKSILQNCTKRSCRWCNQPGQLLNFPKLKISSLIDDVLITELTRDKIKQPLINSLSWSSFSSGGRAASQTCNH